MRKLLSYLMTLLTLSACTSVPEQEGPYVEAPLEDRPVTITFSVPDVRIASPDTKSLESGDGLITGEPYLDPDKLYVVVCGGKQSIKYIRKAEIVKDKNTGEPKVTVKPVSEIKDYPLSESEPTVKLYTFTVQLELSDTDDRTVYFLGNIDENQLVTGSYSYQILPSMFSFEGKQAYWQSVSNVSVGALKDDDGQPVIDANGSYLPNKDTEALFEYVPLIRNYAKIQVTNDTAEDDHFELDSYALIYYPKKGTVAPFRTNSDDILDAFKFHASETSSCFSGYEHCSFIDLDETLKYPGYIAPGVEFDNTIPTDDMFKNPESSGGRVIKYDSAQKDQGFYLFERGIPSASLDPTFVIIRGRFGGVGEFSYYRLDLMEPKIVNNESVYQYYPIYRNFRYNIMVNRISSVGVSTPEAAAKSSGVEDISADVSMRYLSDISNGLTRLVVEPFMAKTYTGPNEDGYYYLYARFFNNLNSAEPNVDWGAVSVELEPMEDMSEDILVLYDDVGNDVHSFYPSAQKIDGVDGFRVIRFNTKASGTETKMQKIKITGRNLYTHEEYPLYREVEITLQKKQTMTVACGIPEIPLQKEASQVVNVTIPAGLPSSMFPLEFIIEPERHTLTPDNRIADNNLPVRPGTSISDADGYAGKTTIQYIRTLTEDEYRSLTVTDGTVTFSSFFKSNTSVSATTVWVANDYFIKGYASFDNVEGVTGHFYVQADYDYLDGCNVAINLDNLEYNLDEEGWMKYDKNTVIHIEKGHKVAFRSTKTTKGLNGSDKFYCYSPGSEKSAKDGRFSIGGNIASLLVGDSFEALGTMLTDWSFQSCFTGHENLKDASELILPMLECPENGYKNMFKGCTGLTGIPLLPATTLAKSCYESMFEGCTSLAILPNGFVLPAASMASYCYKSMFRNSGLTTAPALPATTLADFCYNLMFAECTSLSTSSSPILLPASTLAASCYKEMFSGATGVNEVICLATDKSASNCVNNWLKDVAASGTFWAPIGLTWNWPINSASGIPTGWTKKDYAIPIFPVDPPFNGEIDL